MTIYIDRQGFCMADDALSHKTTVSISSIQDLKNYLRNYLPEIGKPCVWVVYVDCMEDDRSYVLFYYYTHNKLNYFVDTSFDMKLNDGDKVYCGLFTEDLINNDDRFSAKGSLMFRVQQYFNDLNM